MPSPAQPSPAQPVRTTTNFLNKSALTKRKREIPIPTYLANDLQAHPLKFCIFKLFLPSRRVGCASFWNSIAPPSIHENKVDYRIARPDEQRLSSGLFYHHFLLDPRGKRKARQPKKGRYPARTYPPSSLLLVCNSETSEAESERGNNDRARILASISPSALHSPVCLSACYCCFLV